jgi:hypothetical protein
MSIEQRGGGDEADLVMGSVDGGFHGHRKMEMKQLRNKPYFGRE